VIIFNILLLFSLSNLVVAEAFAEGDVTVQPSPTKIGIEEAKKFAVNNNYRVKSFLRKVDAFKASKSRSNSSFYPKIGIAGGARQEISGPQSDTTPVVYAYGNINLFNGFRDSYNSQIAELMTEKSWIELERIKFLVELDVEEQFHRFLYFRDLINVQNEALSLNGNHQRLVKKTQSTGMASNTDVMEFDLKESALRSDMIALNQGLETARINLKRLLGEEIGSKIEPVGKLQHQHIEGELMTYLSNIKKHSIPIKLASKEHAVAVVNAKKWRSKWMPTIDFEAQAGMLDQDVTPEDGNRSTSSVSFQLVAKLELFSGMEAYWQRRETEALTGSSVSELKNEILTSISEMEQSYRELKSIEYKVDLESGNLPTRQKYYESVLNEYKRGFKNSADLSSASDGLFGAKSRQLDYKFDFLKQRLAFEKSYGAPIKVTIVKELTH